MISGFAVSLDGVGMATTGVVLCHQLRTLDTEARQGLPLFKRLAGLVFKPFQQVGEILSAVSEY